MKGEIADLHSMGKYMWGGACNAAAFLLNFVEKNTIWAHLDIAPLMYKAAPKGIYS